MIQSGEKTQETVTVTSSDNGVVVETSEGVSPILVPGTKEYETALEKIYGKRPEIDWLGRKPKSEGKTVAARTGFISPREPTLPLEKEEEHHVLVMKDHVLDFPELWFAVHVLGPPEDTRGFATLFGRAMCRKAESIEKADLVVFTGGPDVDPAYYGEKPHMTTYNHPERDYQDIAAYMTCLEQGIPMTGVCRGAQFLAVMNGYKLFQDVNNHNGDHAMWDVQQKMMIERVSSVHHQQVIPGEGMEILGVAHKSTKRWKNDKDYQEAVDLSRPFTDLEAYFIADTCCLGVQGHPEYRDYNAFAKWYLEMLYSYITLNPNLENRDHCMRLKQENIDLRPSKPLSIQGS